MAWRTRRMTPSRKSTKARKPKPSLETISLPEIEKAIDDYIESRNADGDYEGGATFEGDDNYFILPNGEEFGVAVHDLTAQEVLFFAGVVPNPSPHQALKKFLDVGIIRAELRDNSLNVEMHQKPTPEQIRALEDLSEQNWDEDSQEIVYYDIEKDGLHYASEKAESWPAFVGAVTRAYS